VSRPALFPTGWIRGYIDANYSPPHSEPDLGRCASITGQFGGVNAPCADFVRYTVGGYVEVQPLGRTLMRRVFIYSQSRYSMGNNVPGVSYTHAATPIAYEGTVGAGIELRSNLEVRAETHSVIWLGRYGGYLGPADVHTTGPYGNYSSYGLRWKFGGWGHSSGPH
jgi:hypothetical protein